MRVWLEEREITGLCTRVTVEKSLEAAGASCEVLLVCAPMDSRLPRLDPACGQWVAVTEEQETLFSGRIERVSYDAAALRLSLLCYDPASLLVKNHCRGPYSGTPAEITRQLCRECGLVPGEIWQGDGQPVQLGRVCGRGVYRTICNLYDDRCAVDYRNGRVQVYPKGQNRALLESGRLVSLTARNDSQEAVNRVRIYRKGDLDTEVVDQDSIDRLGLRSRDAYLSLQYEDARQQAQAELQGVSRQARLVFTGRNPVKCGQIVALDKPLMGVYGDYLVTQVLWQQEKGLITTELGVVSL